MATTDIRREVRSRYASVAKKENSSCGPTACCRPSLEEERSKNIGYSDEELSALPEGANLGLGCGNPLALSSVNEGDTVVDLGSGGGIDCFLAAKRVGKTGRVIGVDMTPEMLDRARANAEKGGYDNVEFRLGEIEALPIPDNSVDAIISNCVINLSPDKDRVFSEIFRVLKPGGKIFVSDIVVLNKLPEAITRSIAAYAACVGGALMKDDYLRKIGQAGLTGVTVTSEDSFPLSALSNDPTTSEIVREMEEAEGMDLEDLAGSIASIKVTAEKPE